MLTCVLASLPTDIVIGFLLFLFTLTGHIGPAHSNLHTSFLTLCMLGNFSCPLLTFFRINFFKKSFRNIIRVPNSIDSDQDRHPVSPDLGPNCLQSLSADDKIHRYTIENHFYHSLAYAMSTKFSYADLCLSQLTHRICFILFYCFCLH